MIYAMVDLTGDRVVDVLVTSGASGSSSAERKESQLKELTNLYVKLAGKKRDFSSLPQARDAIIKIVHRRCFPDKETDKLTTDKPVATVRRICSEMKGFPRKDIIEACARLGVKRSTASVQYQKFRTLQNQGKGVSKSRTLAMH